MIDSLGFELSMAKWHAYFERAEFEEVQSLKESGDEIISKEIH